MKMETKEEYKTDETPESTDQAESTEAAITPEMEKLIAKMIQSETDKVRTKYVKDIEGLKNENETIKKKAMSDEEKRKYDLDQLQKQLAEKEKDVLHKEMALKTVDLLKANDLPLEFKEFITVTSEDELSEKLTKLKAIWLAALQQQVDGTFKAGGRTVERTMAGAQTEIQKLEEAYNKATNNADKVRYKMQLFELQKQK